MFILDDKPKKLEDLIKDYDFIKSNKRIEYLNIPCAFDIEASSFYIEDEKQACMYAWVFGMNGSIMFGRTWDEFAHVLKALSEYYELDPKNKRLIIYVHNLSYEFQWIKDRFKWHQVFALKEREVVYALTETGIEFRCSYVLSGYSLKKLGEQCIKYPVKKMVGDLDYSKIRHCKTALTPKEWKYIANDGLVVMSFIQQEIEKHQNNISLIPLTKTGYVRNFCRKNCFYEDNKKSRFKFRKYQQLMRSLTINSVEEYEQDKRAFAGGHTHANPLAIGEVHHDVQSMDFTSSYPYVMLSEKFPMTKAEKIKIHSKEEFEENIELYCCIFDCTFYGLESITPFEHWIPSSKCFNKLNYETDNGKIVNAEKISISITEVDFKVIKNFYTWEHIGVSNFRRYRKGYLPKDFILSILKLYELKTTLKGVEGKEIEYMQAKGDLNSCYGMTVTDICRDEIDYINQEWTSTPPDFEKMLNKYNKSKNRFLFYVWGLYVTSYARRNLSDGILELKYDYLYADTDSVKFIHPNNHKDYFNNYNSKVKAKLLKMLNNYKLDPALIEPKTIKGKTKLIGVWDDDGHYKAFKTLGAKRYMVQYDNYKYNFTLAGCSKFEAIPYLNQQVRIKNKLNKIKGINETVTIFDLFDNGMYIPASNTGKNLHSYIDSKQDGLVTDYHGVEAEYHELSSVHLEPIDFTMSMPEQFLNYLLGLRGVL